MVGAAPYGRPGGGRQTHRHCSPSGWDGDDSDGDDTDGGDGGKRRVTTYTAAAASAAIFALMLAAPQPALGDHSRHAASTTLTTTPSTTPTTTPTTTLTSTRSTTPTTTPTTTLTSTATTTAGDGTHRPAPVGSLGWQYGQYGIGPDAVPMPSMQLQRASVVPVQGQDHDGVPVSIYLRVSRHIVCEPVDVISVCILVATTCCGRQFLPPSVSILVWRPTLIRMSYPNGC